MENKNTGLKVLVGILIILVLAMGGFILYDKVLKDKYFSKDSDKTNEVKKDTDEKNIEEENKEKYNDTTGKIDIDLTNSSVEIFINNKKHILDYKDNEGLKLDSKVIFEKTDATGIGNLKYYVFTANDDKQYLLITYWMYGMYGFIVNDSGNVLSEFGDYSNDIECFIQDKNEEDLISLKNGKVYYYKYVDDSLNETNNNLEIMIEEIEITIENNKIYEKLTGNQKAGQVVQCS